MTSNPPLYGPPQYPHWSPYAFGPKSDAMPAPAELGQTNDPRVLIPGDPAVIQAKLSVLERLASGFDQAATSFGKIGLDDDSWQGSAGDAARTALNREIPAWDATAAAFDTVRTALQDYSYALDAAQNQAAQAIDLYNKGQQASEAATAQYNRAKQQRKAQISQGASPPHLPPFADPGQADLQEAQAILQDARGKVASAGSAAASMVRGQGDSAPQGPGPLERLGGRAADLGLSVLKTGGHLLGGAASAVGSIVKPLLGTAANPIMLLTHSLQAETESMNMAAGLVHAAVYPVDTAKGIVAWDDWSKDPAAALGKAGVNIGSFFIGGEAVAAKGAEIGTQAANFIKFVGKADKTAGEAGNLGKAGTTIEETRPGPLKTADWAEPIHDGAPFGPHGGEPVHDPKVPQGHDSTHTARSSGAPEGHPPVGHMPSADHASAEHPPVGEPVHPDAPHGSTPDSPTTDDARPGLHPADAQARPALQDIGRDSVGMQQSLHGILDNLDPHPDVPGGEHPAPGLPAPHDPAAPLGHETPPPGHPPGRPEAHTQVGHLPSTDHAPADHEPLDQPVHPGIPHGHTSGSPVRDYAGNPQFHASEADRQAFRDQIQVDGGEVSTDNLRNLRDRLHRFHPGVGNVSDEELIAMYRYTGGYYKDINEALREVNPVELRRLDAEIKNAVSGMNKLPDWQATTEHPLVYRGIDVNPSRLPDVLSRYAPGEIVAEPGFTSGARDHPFGGNVQFFIEPHYGKNLEFVNLIEKEVCWPPYNRFEVLGRKFDEASRQWKIYLRDLGR